MKKHIENILSTYDDDISYSRPKDAVLDVALFVHVSTSAQTVYIQLYHDNSSQKLILSHSCSLFIFYIVIDRFN